MDEGEGEQRYLPPEPSGPEPDLTRPEELPVQGFLPPAGASWQPPPGYAQQPPPGYMQPPPPGSVQPQQEWQPQPPGWHGQAPWEPHPGAPQPGAWQPRPAVPDNGPAVAGFSLSLTAGALLVITAGLSSVISIVCAGLGIVYSRRGRARVDRGETPKHRGLAQAGFIIGIVALVLAVLATIGWIVLFSDDNFWDDLDNELNKDPDGTPSTLTLTATRVGTVALRTAASLL